MRKLFLSLVIIPVFSIALCAQEQLDFNNPAFGAVLTGPQVVSGHAVSLTILGLEYSYEHPLGGNWSLIGRAGFPCTLTNVSRSDFSWGPRPGLAIESRYYTNLMRRYEKGKKTLNNSADFVSLQLKPYFADEFHLYLSVIAVYGIRRGTEHWFREYTCGIAYHTKYGGLFPHLGFRFGYSF